MFADHLLIFSMNCTICMTPKENYLLPGIVRWSCPEADSQILLWHFLEKPRKLLNWSNSLKHLIINVFRILVKIMAYCFDVWNFPSRAAGVSFLAKFISIRKDHLILPLARGNTGAGSGIKMVKGSCLGVLKRVRRLRRGATRVRGLSFNGCCTNSFDNSSFLVANESVADSIFFSDCVSFRYGYCRVLSYFTVGQVSLRSSVQFANTAVQRMHLLQDKLKKRF